MKDQTAVHNSLRLLKRSFASITPWAILNMTSIISKLINGKRAPPSSPEGIIEVNKELSVKTLLPQEFGLTDLDLLETVGTGTFGRIRIVKNLANKQFYALKIMKKSRIGLNIIIINI